MSLPRSAVYILARQFKITYLRVLGFEGVMQLRELAVGLVNFPVIPTEFNLHETIILRRESILHLSKVYLFELCRALALYSFFSIFLALYCMVNPDTQPLQAIRTSTDYGMISCPVESILQSIIKHRHTMYRKQRISCFNSKQYTLATHGIQN